MSRLSRAGAALDAAAGAEADTAVDAPPLRLLRRCHHTPSAPSTSTPAAMPTQKYHSSYTGVVVSSSPVEVESFVSAILLWLLGVRICFYYGQYFFWVDVAFQHSI